MALKKAAKKAVKKSAKKSVKKAAKKGAKHQAGHDLRRAYEHLGRLEVLQGGLPGAVVTDINALTQMARTSLQAGDTKNAADLLRGCEHLAFAALATGSRETQIGNDLQEAIDGEYEHLVERAVEHWDEQDEEPSGALTAIYEKTFAAAEAAYNKGAFRRSLELARGAEALSHVHSMGDARLAPGSARRSLKS
jgi:hypothetical protein